METKPKYRMGFMTVLFVVVMIGQYISTTYIQRDFDEKLQQCHEAANQSTLLLTALINKLQEKKIVDKSEVLLEAQNLSADLKTMIQKIEAEQKQKTSPQPSGEVQKQ
jgi:uncharacterized protein (DUF342 family)